MQSKKGGKVTVIDECFLNLKEKNQGAFIPFITVGYPSIAESLDLVFAYEKAGADLIELGIAFSDPMADGPTIQETSQIALKNGITLKKSLECVNKLRQKGLKVPIILMGYANPFLAYGIRNFAIDAAKAGVNGLIVPDLPPGEANDWVNELKPKGMDMIFFLSPTTSSERMRKVIALSSGFIYCLSVTGVTGARRDLSDSLPDFIKRAKKETKIPLVVGFGISDAGHVRDVVRYADGVVVASAILKEIKKYDPLRRCDLVKKYVSELKQATIKSG